MDIIEAGFAASSPGDFDAVSAIAREVRTPTIASLARCVPGDIDAAWNASREPPGPRIHTFISSSDSHLMDLLRKNPEEVLDQAVSSVERARNLCDNVEFSPMDATRTDIEYLYRMLEACINAGATTVNIPDTVGYALPSGVRRAHPPHQGNVPNIDKAIISVHLPQRPGKRRAEQHAAS